MKIELFEKWIQISIDKDSYFLSKALSFASKHFAKNLRLSSSVLVLDECNERYKKTYFFNWAYHLSIHKESDKTKLSFAKLLEHSHLPIRIKTTDNKALVERVNVLMKFISEDKILLHLDKQNRLAKRYLLSKFRQNVISYTKTEFFLRNDSTFFWESLMNSMAERTIHNVALKFEYDKWEANDFRGKDEYPSYLTKEEKLIRHSYRLLELKHTDTFDTVKNKYLTLAREYHPDNVFGQDKEIVDIYAKKFRMIKEAYENIKKISFQAA